MPKLPEIRIQYASLLAEAASVPMNELWGDGSPLESYEFYEQIVIRYQKAWKPYETKVLKGLCSILGITFRQNIIDVYVAPWFNAFSFPLVIGVTLSDDQFVNTLCHELVHRLLTDHNEAPFDSFEEGAWERLFGANHSFNTFIHIPIHIVCKELWTHYLNEPQRVDQDIMFVKEWPDYAAAWNYVQANDYKKLVAGLKKIYARD